MAREPMDAGAPRVAGPLPVGGPPPAGEALLTVRGLEVRYPGDAAPALDGIDLEVRAGELVGLLGLDGSGKSTLARCLAGVIPQLVEAEVRGEVRVAGLDPVVTPVHRMATVVGLVLDEPAAQLSQATAAEEVALGLESLAVPPAEMRSRVDRALAEAGLADAAGRSPFHLSGGEQQRLLVAAVMAMRPPLLVLDEPTAGLDPAGRRAAFDRLGALADGGAAILVAEQDLELVAERADRVIVLRDGRLVADGPPGQVLGDPELPARTGLRPPVAAELAARLGAPGPLPVTLEAGTRWLATLRG